MADLCEHMRPTFAAFENQTGCTAFTHHSQNFVVELFNPVTDPMTTERETLKDLPFMPPLEPPNACHDDFVTIAGANEKSVS
jgi:hypothetical protein